jgi:hypothetical protein
MVPAVGGDHWEILKGMIAETQRSGNTRNLNFALPLFRVSAMDQIFDSIPPAIRD